MSRIVKTATLVGASALFIGCAATASTTGGGDSAVSCKIEETRSQGGVVLEAVADSAEPVGGTYRFEVRKSGGGGTSNSSQSGDFTLSGGEPAVLSQIALGDGGRLAYDAELTLTWKGGEVSCQAG